MANTFTFANQTLTDADIFGGISYICDLNTGDEFSIGNTASASVSFVTDKQVPLYTKDQTNGFFEWTQDNVSRGKYYVTEVTKVNGTWYSVTAYDAMILLETSITSLSLSYPLTVSAAASAIAAYIGCTVSGTIYNGTQTALAGTIDDTVSIRKLLGWVAEASGASVKIDAADHIVFLYYAASGITVTASDYKEDGLDVADYTCAAIDNVTICDMAGMTAATAGSGTNSLFIQGNPFLYEATSTEAAVILGLVDSFVYAPFTCEMFDENGLDVGMTATFGTVTTLVMHIESDEDGAVASAVGSDSRAEFNKSLDIIVNEALSVANAAQQTADNLNLHFWYTASGAEAGAHIAEVDKPTFETNPAGGNLLSNTNGIKVRKGLDDLATFGASGATIGVTDGTQSYVAMDYHSMQMIDKEGDVYFHISDLRDASGEWTPTDTFTGDGTTKIYTLTYNVKLGTHPTITIDGVSVSASAYVFYIPNRIEFTTAPTSGSIIETTYTTTANVKAYTIGIRTEDSVIGGMSVAESYDNTASGRCSHAEGSNTEASGNYAHAEGNNTEASGYACHAEGGYTVASESTAHAEGYHTVASKANAHAEGSYTTASGGDSHAEGSQTTASGYYAHAEGENTTASGWRSHSQNQGTIALKSAQTTLGSYNEEDTANTTTHPSGTNAYGTYAVIVGNGTDDDDRSNALAVDWTGDVFLAVDTTSASGTDYDLYTAITALGWDSDVIV